MARSSGRRRKCVGQVSYYVHHGGWHLYYRERGRQVRRRVAENESDAKRIAAQVNAQLAAQAPTLFSFVPLTVAELRRRFLAHHENVLQSSLATINRYTTATQHLENFTNTQASNAMAHEIDAAAFVAHLRQIRVPPNGHANTRVRNLRGKGVLFILECCRSMFNFAGRMRHLPPYKTNPFAELPLDRIKIQDAKPIFVFDEETELAFFKAVDSWAFPIHFTLAKTGMRPGELVHLLIEDLDLEDGWLQVRGKPEVGWQTKVGRDRTIPLISELTAVLRNVIHSRKVGPVFLRPMFLRGNIPKLVLDRVGLAKALESRVNSTSGVDSALARRDRARLARTVWRDAGAIDTDAIRTSFIRTMRKLMKSDATCPKSWRHTFATLLQDANVDPLIRQLTMGHQPAVNAGLGMTAHYTHTRTITLKTQVEGALRQWPKSLQFAWQWAQGGAL